MNQQQKLQQKSRNDGPGRYSTRPSVNLESVVYGKVPPQAKELEVVVLGAILLEKDALDTVAEILRPECFYVDAHQRIFRCMLGLAQKNMPIDLHTLGEELSITGELENVGGSYYLTSLTNSVVSAANIEVHARIIHQKFLQREIIRVSGEIIGQAYDDTVDVFDLLDRFENDVMAIGTENMPGTELDVHGALVKTLQQIETWRAQDKEITGVPSGFPSIDRATRGFQPGDLVIIAARPSVGKTAFALNLIRNACTGRDGVPVAIWSLEMGVVSLMLRMLAAESGIIMHKLQTGQLSDENMAQLYRQGVQVLAERKIYFDDTSSVSIGQLRAKARRLKKKRGIGLIVVDYLQLMRGKDGGNREQEIASISRELKNLGRELQVPVIALSQLSRDIEKRSGTNRSPQLSDLRESGAIEQDADLVMFLWKPSDEEIATNAEMATKRFVKIAKQRNGTLITEELEFRNEIQLFEKIDALASPGGSWKPIPRDYSQSTRENDQPF